MSFCELNCRGIKSGMYKINEYGDIYSEYTKNLMHPKSDKDGYLSIGLKTVCGKVKMFRVATLVLITFVGECPASIKDPTVNHIDSNIVNNHYTNLEWMERRENSSIRENKGAGELNHEAKLSENDVLKIIEYIKMTTLSIQKIGELFNVDKSTIHNIMHGKNWKHLIDENLSKYRVLKRDNNGKFYAINPFLQEGVGL